MYVVNQGAWLGGLGLCCVHEYGKDVRMQALGR